MGQPKIWGLTPEVQQKLKAVAKERTGKASLSALARTLLLAQLDNLQITTAETKTESKTQLTEHKKHRLELRLNPNIYTYLHTAARQQSMTANTVAADIISHYVTTHPVLSDKEAEALYQSNYQLLRIGRNLNQIARQLNIGETGSITSGEIQQLREVIEKHTEKVQDVLLANKRRFE